MQIENRKDERTHPSREYRCQVGHPLWWFPHEIEREADLEEIENCGKEKA